MSTTTMADAKSLSQSSPKSTPESSTAIYPIRSALVLLLLVLLGAYAPSYLYLLGFIGVIVVTHEAGHFFAARASGMRPSEFYWGFGPELFGVTVGDCRYGLKAIFLGGYVKLEGMTAESELPEGFDEADTYRAASYRGRIFTILAGPFTNLASAVLAFALAARLGGAEWGSALGLGVDQLWLVIASTFEALATWFAGLGDYVRALFGENPEAAPIRFLSPVGQASVTGEVVGRGLTASLQWFGILACAIGAVNLLPLPPLDGSHAFVAIGEKLSRMITGREVIFDLRKLVPLAYMTVGLLVLLSVSALVLDLRAPWAI